MTQAQQDKNNKILTTYDTLIVGGGIAGLVTAYELLKKGQLVCIIDRDTPERLGGLARWAFGGMALSETKQQKKLNIPDSREKFLADWYSFAEFTQDDHWPKQWAKEYTENNNQRIYQYLLQLGLRFLPAVNWVERGLFGEGNSLPRYHVLWGTGWHLVEIIIEKLRPFQQSGQLTIMHQHKMLHIHNLNNQVSGGEIVNEQNNQRFILKANNTVIACGGINGSHERVKQNWPTDFAMPQRFLNGANPISDGQLHDEIKQLGGKLTHLQNMWNYAAGINHTQAEFEDHGLSLIPCKSALWLDHRGKRIGALPLVTGFDTRYLCQQVCKQEKPWTWQLLNWKIAAKELAVSGALHNPSIRNKSLFGLLKELLLGNNKLIKQLEHESDDFIVADNLSQLVAKMNSKTDQAYIHLKTLAATVKAYDQQLHLPSALQNDDQIRRIHHARQWSADKLRTGKPAPIIRKGVKLIAIKCQLISRKSLGGVQTNLASQVLNEQGNVIENLYCVGEAAGFGGGGANGIRSLEGTFLSGCILTARNAADAIAKQSKEVHKTKGKNT
jgi:hypothetical protein